MIVPQADPRTRTFPVKVRVKNEVVNGNVRLKAGMFAQVTLASTRTAKRRMIPKDALVLGGQSSMVYAVVPDGPDAPAGRQCETSTACASARASRSKR